MIIVGIDLGTSNSSICYFKNGKMNIIKDNNSHNISSIISITKYGNVFGNKAKSIKDNNIFISNIKRLIGYKYDELDESYYNQFSFKIIKMDDNNIGISIDDENQMFSINELMIYFLNYLKQLIDLELGLDEYKVIVTVPAYFNIQQKEAINNCINATGFNLIKLLSEPTSACIAYNNFINVQDNNNILVFDLGGGTLDLSIINISNDIDDPEKSYEVIATYGNNKFGGSDLTFLLIDYIKSKYPSYSYSNKNLFDHIDSLKIKLSNGLSQVSILIDDQSIVISSDEFDKIVSIWLNNIENNFEEILNIAKASKDSIKHIFLVGGTSKIKQIKTILLDYFGVNVQSHYINDNIPLSDIAVAYGAALHGYISISSRNIVLMDVCPFTIGIETVNGIMVPIIDRNSPIPISRTKQFTTDEDDMTEVKIKIFQGESKLVKNNIYINEFTLNGIKKAFKGIPVINVNITINSDGLLRIVASDRKNFTRNEIIVSAKDYNLDDKTVENIKENMLKNRDGEDRLFNLIESYNKFVLDYDRFIFNLIINPVSTFESFYIDNIKLDIIDKVLQIKNISNVEIFSDLLSFNKFNELTDILFTSDELTNCVVFKEYNDVLIYLKILFDKFKDYLNEKYPNLLMSFNNDNLEHKTYDKNDVDCSITEDNENIININVNVDSDNIMTSSINDLKNNVQNISDTDEYNIKAYELIELVKSLIDNLDDLPIDENSKESLILYLNDKKTLMDNLTNNTTIDYLQNMIDDINNYCEKLVN